MRSAQQMREILMGAMPELARDFRVTRIALYVVSSNSST